MQWQVLTKESLEILKQDRLTFWCYIKDISPIVNPLYKICAVCRIHNHPSSGDYWFLICLSINGGQIRETITDGDMIEFFSHYCIVDEPENQSYKISEEK